MGKIDGDFIPYNNSLGSSTNNVLSKRPRESSAKEGAPRECRLNNCLICRTGEVPSLRYSNNIGWGDSVSGAFYCILESDPTKGPWLSLTDDIYPLFEAHWSQLCPHRKWENQEFWKKHIQDSLSHKKCFLSGRDVFGQTGYWRMKDPHPNERLNNAAAAAANVPNTINVAKRPRLDSTTPLVARSTSPTKQLSLPNPQYSNPAAAAAATGTGANSNSALLVPVRAPPPFDEHLYSANLQPRPLGEVTLSREFSSHFMSYLDRVNASIQKSSIANITPLSLASIRASSSAAAVAATPATPAPGSVAAIITQPIAQQQ